MSGLVESSADARSKTIGENFRVRAWVNFNGDGTVAIRSSGNVSSITDNAPGDYTVNFTTSIPDANYAVSISACDTDNSAGYGYGVWVSSSNTAVSAGSIRFGLGYPDNATFYDADLINVAIFR